MKKGTEWITHNAFHAVNRQPTLSCVFKSVLICTGCVLAMQCNVSHIAARIDERVASRGRRETKYEQESKYKHLHWCRLHMRTQHVSRVILAPTYQQHERSNVLLGCHISVKNFIFGGLNGKSIGNDMVALKKPPSYKVSVGPKMVNSHS